MKFMKLGSKPDSFQIDGKDGRFVVSELPTNIIVKVGKVKFYLHKFPLLSKSLRVQKLITTNNNERNEIQIPDIPGGAAAFEICAKFCYGMTVTLNAHNVIATRCAAEYLEMNETTEKGNLIYKIEVFLRTSIFQSWKDSIVVLKTTKFLLPWSEELKLVGHCIDSIACKASVDALKVDWSYTYTRTPNQVRNPQSVPKDWWVEDLCQLELGFYKQVIESIKGKARVSSKVLGEALKVYIYRRLPGFQKGDNMKSGLMLETIVRLLPEEKCSVSCNFLLKLLKAANLLDCSETCSRELVKRIGGRLEEVSVADLVVYDMDTVRSIVEEFVIKEKYGCRNSPKVTEDEKEIALDLVSDGSKMMVVANLVDAYLAEIAKDEHLALLKFVDLAEMFSDDSRPVHDGLYRAIDMYLKEHPSLTKSERKKLCSLMDCRKLSSNACSHAIQNDRLPLRVVVQVLFHEQARASSGPDSSSNAGSYGSSRTTATTNTTEDNWVPPVRDHLDSFKSMNLNASEPKSMLLSRNMKL